VPLCRAGGHRYPSGKHRFLQPALPGRFDKNEVVTVAVAPRLSELQASDFSFVQESGSDESLVTLGVGAFVGSKSAGFAPPDDAVYSSACHAHPSASTRQKAKSFLKRSALQFMNSLFCPSWFCAFAGFLGRIPGESVDANSHMSSDWSIHGDAARRDAELDSCTTVIAESLPKGTEHSDRYFYSSGLVDFNGQSSEEFTVSIVSRLGATRRMTTPMSIANSSARRMVRRRTARLRLTRFTVN
jgi:hypothetical protein